MNDIITKRPENMSFEEYKELRKEQKFKERKNRTGALVYRASVIYKDEMTNKAMRRTFPPAVKSYDMYGNVKYVAMKKKAI